MAPPLEGLKVVDMGWLMVGPESARCLADLGADVVKLESGVRRDPMRAIGPFKNGVSGPNRSFAYHAINAGKRSLTLDVKDVRGREVVLRLARWADVFIEAFTPGVLDSLKLSYEYLSQVNPGLIMVSTSVLGAQGPNSEGTSGTGNMGSAFAGATNLMGWPDRDPMGPYGPWTDSVTPRFIVSTVLAALHRRRRTQQGCFIDASQAECGIQFLMPAYFDYAVNGVSPQRRGAAGSPLRSPAGLYPCTGADRWVAIDASEDEPWLALRTVIGGDLADRNYDTLIGRLRNRHTIDAAISAYTSAASATAVEQKLQEAGVPCHVVSQPVDLSSDTDLAAQGYYWALQDAELGELVTRGPPARLNRTAHVPTRAGPHLGDSSRDILKTACGFSDVEIDEFERCGLLR
jgi:benzylsuccinate CoA-transferase BbsF subunit